MILWIVSALRSLTTSRAMSELKVLGTCCRAIEKLEQPERERVASYLVARYTAHGRMTIRLAVELAELLGDKDRARDARHHLLDELLEIGPGKVSDQ